MRGGVLSALLGECKWVVKLKTETQEVLKDSLWLPLRPESTTLQRTVSFFLFFLIKTPGKHLFLSHNNKGPSKQYEYISELPSQQRTPVEQRTPFEQKPHTAFSTTSHFSWRHFGAE